MLLVSTAAFGQSYIMSQSTGAPTGYVLGDARATAQLSSGNDVMSGAIALPFTFDFYGASYTDYYISDNGYIRFGSAGTSNPNNANLPAVSPNNAIYGFWDDFWINSASGAGTVDLVYNYTYGTAPNRVHVVQWWSVSDGPSGTGNYAYFAILLHENHRFQIVHNGANISGLSGTVGCENALSNDTYEVSGAPNQNMSNDFQNFSDDIVYTFIYAPNNLDVSIESETGLMNTVTSGSNSTVTGKIMNLGSTVVTDMDIHYTIDGGSQVDETISGLSLARGSETTYTFAAKFSPSAPGVVNDIDVWVDNINGMTDENTADNDLSKDVLVNTGTTTNRTVLIEEFTGAWCGWCPGGAVIVDDLITAHGSNVAAVAIHQGDDMMLSGFNTFAARFEQTSYPAGMIDRNVFAPYSKEPHTRSAWTANTAAQLSAGASADVSLNNVVYDAGTRTVTADVTANFKDYVWPGDYRIHLYIIEDKVTGTGSGYDQVNYYSGNANFTSHPFYSQPDPITGFEHNHTLRAALPDFDGKSGVIPGTMVALNTDYTESFSYTLPGNFDEKRIKVIGFASAMGVSANGESWNDVLNSDEEALFDLSGIEEKLTDGAINITPNPTNGWSVVNFNLTQNAQVDVSLYNMVGQKLSTLKNGKLAAGNQSVVVSTTDLEEGIYFIRMNVDGEETTSKLVVLK
jgi:hypothetical protein